MGRHRAGARAPQQTSKTVRNTGIEVVGHVPWGTHLCQFYEGFSDLAEIVIPYLRAGLEANECCLWIACDPRDAETARGELLRSIPDAARHHASGAVEIIECSQWYLIDGHFDPERVVARWEEKLRVALARGYEGVRVHANEAGLPPLVRATFASYEQALNEFVARQPILVLCTYLLTEISGHEVFDAAHAHEIAIARRSGAWNMLQTPAVMTWNCDLRQLNRQLKRRVEVRTRELALANDAHRDSEELYRLLAENTNDLITLRRLDGRFVYASSSFERLLGRPAAGTIDQLIDRFHPDDRESGRRAWQSVLDGTPVQVTFRYQHANGLWIWLEAWGKTVLYKGEQHVLSVARDITERRRLEDENRQAQKMEAIGRLAGGVAHDFNNLLTIILGYTDLVREQVAGSSEVAADLNEICRAAERARGVTRQLLALSRRQVPQAEVLDLSAVLGASERMLRLLAREDINFEVRSSNEVLSVLADPIQIEQVLLNLVANARDATAGGGTIVIEASYVDTVASQLALPSSVRPGRYARLAVRDTGTGMTHEIAARIFEPFFTTKPAETGTGLGLSTVAEIVKQSGGYVWVESEPGHGSTFTVLLPLTKEQKPEPAVKAPAINKQVLEGMKIVLVEDEDAVRHFAADVLRRSGVEVLEFASANEAMAALASWQDTADVLLTDVVLPGMSGPELAQHAAAARPGLKTVYMSGYAPEEVGFADVLARATILKKPFGADELLDQLAQCAHR
jgi:PAS domain S-box-containing protein